jgi:peptidoglycan/xylan/chitin deacetylase (PgdA/CDA1 family)
MYNYLRKYFRDLLLDILSSNPSPSAGIHILNGHFLSLNDDIQAGIFSDQLDILLANGVRYINFDDAVHRIRHRKVPKDQCLIAFTFDDGFEECFTKIRPVLNKFDIKAGFFINPNFIDGDEDYQQNFKSTIVKTNKSPMSWEQIYSLKEEGHTIGAHTMDHANLNTHNLDILEYQIGRSKVYIENKLNSECEYFAFPFGRLKHISTSGIEVSRKYFKYIFSQSNYRFYFSFDGSVINRRHFECDWPYKHVLYFLKEKTFA